MPPASEPLRLIIERAGGQRAEQPCASEAAVWTACERLAPIVPPDATWSVHHADSGQ